MASILKPVYRFELSAGSRLPLLARWTAISSRRRLRFLTSSRWPCRRATILRARATRKRQSVFAGPTLQYCRMPKKSVKTESAKTTLARIKNEMAMPRVCASARKALRHASGWKWP